MQQADMIQNAHRHIPFNPRLLRAGAALFRLAAVWCMIVPAVVISGAAARQSVADQGFTFFDIGRSTPYSENLREQLEDRLGNDAIQRQNIIDLEVHPRPILEQHLPELDRLNRRLNASFGERVEHDTTKLMYRYARNKNLPFSYVAILFSNQSDYPLHIRIEARTDISGIKNTLVEKYGPARTITWESDPGRTEVWELDGDVLLFSAFPNKAGVMQYRIAIYYVDNIKQMLAWEETRRKNEKGDRKSAGGSAF
jgi:hypothetical protein